MARVKTEDRLSRLTPYWREKWEGVPFSVSAVAKRAGLAAQNVQYIVEGHELGQNPKVKTVKRIEDALDDLRDRCPHCYRKGLKQALKEKDTNGPTGRTEDDGGTSETTDEDGGLDLSDRETAGTA